MKVIIVSAFVFLIIGVGSAQSESRLEKDQTDHTGIRNILFVTDHQRTIRKIVYLVGSENTAPQRIVYIFHGYKPKDDPYKQSPAYFIKNWKLDQLAKKYSALFVLPDNGDSVYPITLANDPLSDMGSLDQLHLIISARFKTAQSELSIGFSAGVEGAIKFAIRENIREIVAISGNYDLRLIPVGEMAFHIKSFGNEKDILERESPITLLKNSGKLIYLLCEERNATNVKQAQTLVDAAIPGIKIIDLRALGKGLSHDWTYLTSPGIINSIEKIISGNTHSLVGN